MIKAIFFDVDGTLLSHKTKQIPPDAEQVLFSLKNQGIKIFMSTGRHSSELAELPVNHIDFDGYVTLNGHLCLNGKKQTVYDTPFNHEITETLVHVFQARKYPLALVNADGIYINFINDTVRKAQLSISTPLPEIGQYKSEALYQATAFFTRSEEALLETSLPKNCKFARWCDHGVDIISSEGGKVRGIKYFCDFYGIHPNEVMAFGDAENDIDMLNFAGIGVAMGNAQECVKKTADYVTADVDEGGISLALQHFRILP